MVKTKIIKELKCEFCGKGLRQEVNTWVVGGKEICIKRIPERCNCKQAKEYWKEQDELERIKLLTKLEIENLDKPLDLKFLLMNPFLIYIQKNPNMVRTYLPFILNDSLLDIQHLCLHNQ